MYIVRGSISSISSLVSYEISQGKILAQALELLYENDQLFVLLYLITAGCNWGQKQISYQWMQCQQHQSPGPVPLSPAEC